MNNCLKIRVFGAGGNYLSNEIFYRVCRLREEVATNRGKDDTDELASGHFHLPWMQSASSINSKYKFIDGTRHRRESATNDPLTTIDFNATNTLEMINIIITTIKNLI